MHVFLCLQKLPACLEYDNSGNNNVTNRLDAENRVNHNNEEGSTVHSYNAV